MLIHLLYHCLVGQSCISPSSCRTLTKQTRLSSTFESPQVFLSIHLGFYQKRKLPSAMARANRVLPLVTLAVMACVAMKGMSFVAPPRAELPVVTGHIWVVECCGCRWLAGAIAALFKRMQEPSVYRYLLMFVPSKWYWHVWLSFVWLGDLRHASKHKSQLGLKTLSYTYCIITCSLCS